MIVAIVRRAPSGVVPLEELRRADDPPAALAAFLAAHRGELARDWLAVDTGWAVGPAARARWAWDFDAAALVDLRDPLEDAKAAALAYIDRQTAALVAAAGFDHNGRRFGVGAEILTVLDLERDVIAYPALVATIDNTEIYAVADAAEVHALATGARAARLALDQSAAAAKQQVLEATLADEIEAILQSRRAMP